MYKSDSFFEDMENASYRMMMLKHRQEKIMANHMKAIGISFYLPVYKKIKRYRKGNAEHLLPLFSNYIFFKKDDQFVQELFNLSQKYIHIIDIDENDHQVFISEIKSILQIVESQKTIQPYDHLREGDLVRIKSGPFKDIEGIIIKEQKQYRFVVKISILGQSVSVELDPLELAHV